MKKTHTIPVFIADDHSIVREGLAAVIHRAPDMEVVAQAGNWTEAVERILQIRPEVAILDLHMSGMQPAEAIATLRENVPTAQIIIYSAFGTEEEVHEVICAGARGYVLKGESGQDDLLACIRAVSNGEMWIHPVAAAKLAERMTSPKLTAREIAVLRLMVVGKSNKEIGSSLDVTEGTVKVHVNHILSKFGVTGRLEAVMVAVQRGFVHLAERFRKPVQSGPGEADRGVDPRFPVPPISKAVGSASSSGQLHPKK